MAVSNPVTLGLMWVRGCETQCYRDHSDTGPWLRGLYCTSLPFCPVVSVHCLAFLQQLRKRVSKCKQPLHKNMLFQASSNAIHPKATTVSATVMHRCLGCTRSAYPHHPTSTVIHRMVPPHFQTSPHDVHMQPVAPGRLPGLSGRFPEVHQLLCLLCQLGAILP